MSERTSQAVETAILADLRVMSQRDAAKKHNVSKGVVAALAKRMQVGRLSIAATRAVPEAPESNVGAPESDEALDDVEGDLAVAERLSRAAEAEGNLQGVAAMGRWRVSLLEHRRKARVLTPEEQGMTLVPTSEMEALGATVRERFHKMIDHVMETSEDWPKCPACQRPIAPEAP